LRVEIVQEEQMAEKFGDSIFRVQVHAAVGKHEGEENKRDEIGRVYPKPASNQKVRRVRIPRIGICQVDAKAADRKKMATPLQPQVTG
jgi:hypothetical protein